MVFVLLEMERNSMARAEMEMDGNGFYGDYNKGCHPLWKGINILTIAMIWKDVQIIVGCQRYSLSVFIASANCQSSRGAKNKWLDLPSNSVYFMLSASYPSATAIVSCYKSDAKGRRLFLDVISVNQLIMSKIIDLSSHKMAVNAYYNI